MPDAPLISEDGTVPEEVRPRIVVDFESGTVTFWRCHHTRSFLASRVQERHVCRFEDILTVSDFLTGGARQPLLRAVLAAGPLMHLDVSASELASIFISTRTGRCRVFSHWTNFADLRSALGAMGSEGRPPWSEDPRLMPLFVGAIALVAAAVVCLLL
jgi:hypothetical protein